jgi:hypothetical protein
MIDGLCWHPVQIPCGPMRAARGRAPGGGKPVQRLAGAPPIWAIDPQTGDGGCSCAWERSIGLKVTSWKIIIGIAI